MQKILVFSDTHAGAAGRPEMPANLEAGLRHGLAVHPDADFLVHLGDLADRGLPEDYALVAPMFSEVGIPCIFIPGNHDDRDAMREALCGIPGPGTGPAEFMQARVRLGNTLFLALDTLAGEACDVPLHAGILCRTRLDWLRDRLVEDTPDRVVIFMHHPPFLTGMHHLDNIGLQNGDAFFRVLDLCRAPVHLVCGHLHRTVSGVARGCGFTIVRGSGKPMPLVARTGRKMSGVLETRVAEMTYAVVNVMENSVAVHAQPYDPAETTGRN